MRNKWYSDNRDLVKWATLTYIAKTYGLYTILQVPYLREEDPYPNFSFSEKYLPISQEVWEFFRNMNDVARLGDQLGISVNVVASKFNPKDRNAYISKVKMEMDKLKRPFLLFLDPDTGLEPAQCNPKHTAIIEIKMFWPLLREGEWLILYQHARRSPRWAESVAAELSDLCGKQEVQISRSNDVGKDVAFLCVQKKEVFN